MTPQFSPGASVAEVEGADGQESPTSCPRLHLRPLRLREANEHVERLHRHHKPVRGCNFCVGAFVGDQCVGVGIAGRPVARGLDDGRTIEITRCATDGTPNACSMIYGALRRAAKAVGYQRVVTYTLASEPGVSLLAAGFRRDGEVRGREWACESRPRRAADTTEDKVRWVA